MKKHILFLVALVVVGFGMSRCAEDNVLAIDEPVSAGLVKATVLESNSFFNFLDLQTAALIMDLTTTVADNSPSQVASAEFYGIYTDVSEDSVFERTLITTVTSFPSRLTISSQEFAGTWGLAPADLDGGDLVRLEIEVVMDDGRRFRGRRLGEQLDPTDPWTITDGVCQEENSRGTCFINSFVGCPTEIAAGSYAGTALPCINDPFGQAGNRVADADIDFSQTGAVNWRIDNVDLGYYVGFGFTPQIIEVLDVCNSLATGSRAETTFSITIESGSSYDPAANTAVVRWLDAPNSGIECQTEFIAN